MQDITKIVTEIKNTHDTTTQILRDSLYDKQEIIVRQRLIIALLSISLAVSVFILLRLIA